MPHRRRPETDAKRNRVFWSEAEKKLLIERCLALQFEHPDLAGLPLLREAMYALPTDRRRKIIAHQQVEWYEPMLIEATKKRDARGGDDLEDWQERTLRFAGLEVQLLEEMSGQTEKLAVTMAGMVDGQKEMLTFHNEWAAMHREMHEMFACILGELRAQTELFRRLFPTATRRSSAS